MTDPRLLIPATAELLQGWCGPVLVATTSGTRTDWSDGIVYGDRVLDAARPEDGDLAKSWRDLASEPEGTDGASVLSRYYRLDIGRDEPYDRVTRCILAELGEKDMGFPTSSGHYVLGRVERHLGIRGPLEGHASHALALAAAWRHLHPTPVRP